MKKLLILMIILLFSVSSAYGFLGFGKKKAAESENIDDVILIETSRKGEVVPIVKEYLVPIFNLENNTIILQYGGSEKPIDTFKNVSPEKAMQILKQLYPNKKKFFCLNSSGLFKCGPEIVSPGTE